MEQSGGGFMTEVLLEVDERRSREDGCGLTPEGGRDDLHATGCYGRRGRRCPSNIHWSAGQGCCSNSHRVCISIRSNCPAPPPCVPVQKLPARRSETGRVVPGAGTAECHQQLPCFFTDHRGLTLLSPFVSQSTITQTSFKRCAPCLTISSGNTTTTSGCACICPSCT